MYERMPLQEVKFFAIVIAIQNQIGGNLAEVLSNLAQVLRDRYRLQAKVKAYSAEAKTSAIIIAALPPCVILATYLHLARLHLDSSGTTSSAMSCSSVAQSGCSLASSSCGK